MARDPAGTYSYPPGIEGVPDQTIDSNDYNAFLHDVQADLNFPRPITSGGTNARSATEAMTNLNGEIAKQLVDNYDMFPFAPGSFYSIGGATGEPVALHNFIGICYMKDADNIVLEARDESDTAKPGRKFIRERKITPPATGSAWLPWRQDGLVTVDNGAGDVSIGIVADTADMVVGFRGTAPTSYFAVNTESDGSGTNAVRVNKDGSIVLGGPVTLPSFGPPTDPAAVVPKSYIDAADAATASAAASGVSGANTNANSRVAKTGDTMTGDLTVHRNNNTGYVWLGNGGGHYVGFDGGNYVMPNSHLYTAAGRVWGSSDFNYVPQAPLGFQPVTQGGANRVELRWDGSGCRLQIDNNDTFGHIFTDAIMAGSTVTMGGINCTGTTFGGQGYRCRSGLNGGYTGNYFNIIWVSPYIGIYIDDSQVSTIASDYRLKENVVDLGSTWDVVKKLRPIEYNHKDYTPPTKAAQARAAESGQPFSAGSPDKYWGFIAHELQETLIPTAATGVKDDPNVVQGPNPFVLIAALTKTLQEAMTRIEALEART